jgi:hypothetical protein
MVLQALPTHMLPSGQSLRAPQLLLSEPALPASDFVLLAVATQTSATQASPSAQSLAAVHDSPAFPRLISSPHAVVARPASKIKVVSTRICMVRHATRFRINRKEASDCTCRRLLLTADLV